MAEIIICDLPPSSTRTLDVNERYLSVQEAFRTWGGKP